MPENEIGAFTPQVAQELLDFYRYMQRSGFRIPRTRRSHRVAQDDKCIFVRNDSGEVIPAFGCMEVTGTADVGGQNYTTVVKPTSAGRTFLFNDIAPIEIGGYGIAQAGRKVRAYNIAGTVTVDHLWRQTTGQWYLTEGSGRYMVIEEDNIRSNVFWVRTDFNDIVHFKSGNSGIAALSTLTMGSATCDRYACNDSGVLSDSGEDIVIYNTGGVFGNNKMGAAALNDTGIWVAILEKC